MPPSIQNATTATPMTVIVRTAIVAVTVALFAYSSMHAMLGHRDIAVLTALATPLGISSWGFARAGHHEAAVMLLACVVIAAVSLILVLNPAGVHDVAITAYSGVVMVAAFLLSRRNFAIIAGITAIAAIGVFVRDILIHAHGGPTSHREWEQLATFLLVTSVFGVIARVISEALFGSLGQAVLAASGDPVTGLANRAGFAERAGEMLRAARDDSSQCALVLADLDGYRRLKVVVGHAASDRVLAEAGRRIAAVSPDSFVGRVCDDEFAVFVANIPEARVPHLAREVHDALRFDYSGVNVRGAVGFSRFPRDGDGLDALMLAAESSLLNAKAEADGERIAGPGDRI